MLFVVKAIHSYSSHAATDLSFKEGDTLSVLVQTEEHWWKARDESGKVGMIPSNYISRLGIESEKWVASPAQSAA